MEGRQQSAQNVRDTSTDDANEENALDAFISNLKSSALSKSDIMRMQLELQNLRKEVERLRALVDIAKPANLPSLTPETRQKNEAITRGRKSRAPPPENATLTPSASRNDEAKARENSDDANADSSAGLTAGDEADPEAKNRDKEISEKKRKQYLNPVHNHESQFDALATLYDDMATWPFRKEIEIPAVLEHIGDVAGLNILDFGCGSGHYARLLKSRGAKHVVGYDISGGMLDHARKIELKYPQGIEYTSTLDGLEKQFDFVLAVYVLPYASSREGLQRMVDDMVKALRIGGRLLTLPLNPQYATDHDYYIPYGLQLTADTPHQEGSEIYLHFPQNDNCITITAWYWSRASINEAFEKAGLTNIKWASPQPKNFSSAMDFNSYIDKPHMMLVGGRYDGNKNI